MNHIEAMKQALEALEEVKSWKSSTRWDGCFDEEIASLRQAIEQAEKQDVEQSSTESKVSFDQPVAIYQYQLASGSWIDQTKNSYDYNVRHGQATVRVVYTRPQPQREWVGLTRDQVEELFWPWSNNTEYKIPLFEFRQVYSIIEAKLKEKNT